MSKYRLEIDCLMLNIDISPKEIEKIITEAETVAADGTANPEKTAEAYLKKGQCLQKLEKYAESREPIQKALALFPDMAEALVPLGKIYSMEKNYVEALTLYNRVIRTNSGYAAAYNWRAYVYEQQDKYDEAISDINEAIRLKPDCASFFSAGRLFMSARESTTRQSPISVK